ncbi:MAG: nucleotidyltransferase domain-containing protein [Deltaproteobacteria bacterium]|nr:nucleotidyltransferase domain-containing protein [Deltaproteobacteria bacterium]
MHASKASPLGALHTAAARQGGLTLLVLFGSRARGEASAHADWDFGFLADGLLDPLALMAALAEVVGSERLDLVDLARASGLLRFRAARDGVLVYEARPGSFNRFRFEAARFWYDAEPVLRPAYEALLDRLG